MFAYQEVEDIAEPKPKKLKIIEFKNEDKPQLIIKFKDEDKLQPI
jgi:hypothetical protein